MTEIIKKRAYSKHSIILCEKAEDLDDIQDSDHETSQRSYDQIHLDVDSNEDRSEPYHSPESFRNKTEERGRSEESSMEPYESALYFYVEDGLPLPYVQENADANIPFRSGNTMPLL